MPHLLEDVFTFAPDSSPRPSSQRSLLQADRGSGAHVSGTFSLSILRAPSSPSIPGMRTSMITTCGRRRSTSATAPAPSEASPITRMCGARESERRSPSRTTSWSSTIRHVISSGIGGKCMSRDRRSARAARAELAPAAARASPLPAVADAVLAGEIAHPARAPARPRSGGDRRRARRAARTARAPRASPGRAPRGSAPSCPGRR